MARKVSAAEERLREIHEKLASWNQFVRELPVPKDFAPAMMTGRTELIKLARPRALDEKECTVLFSLVGGLLETNALLQEHSKLVAQVANDARLAFHGAEGMVDRLGNYARFVTPGDDDGNE